MKLVRFLDSGTLRFGVAEDDDIFPLMRDPFSEAGRNVRPEALIDRTRSYRLSDVRLLAPCVPTKYIGIGLNYRETARAMGMPPPEHPVVYIRPFSSIVASGEKIRVPQGADVIAEGELAVVIGRTVRNVSEEDAGHAIFGYTLTNDVTNISQFRRDAGNPTLAKAHDSFAPLGPSIVTRAEKRDWNLSTSVNGRVVQSGDTRDMIFSIDRCISYISQFMTLLPGDVVATGCPPLPVGIADGDEIRVHVDGLGALVNTVSSEPATSYNLHSTLKS